MPFRQAREAAAAADACSAAGRAGGFSCGSAFYGRGWSEQGVSLRVSASRKLESEWDVLRRMDDAAWRRISDALPGKLGARARNGPEMRRSVEAVLWVAGTRARWKDLPIVYGPWRNSYVSFVRWTRAGLWEAVLSQLNDKPVLREELAMLVEAYWARHYSRRLAEGLPDGS
ncbi:transposase [Luteimonas sp. R10]|uniref:transposase n=1 Tax=Luteimonas sp. R10 TaxID=3108176 RepID=UPI00308A419D|nr:transposase [Luteimonas sp. R10]